jgi:hypothetical protein
MQSWSLAHKKIDQVHQVSKCQIFADLEYMNYFFDYDHAVAKPVISVGLP